MQTLLMLWWVLSPLAQATPIYAIRSANRCDTCHIEPTNWANPPKSERKCSLDCAVCHVSPQGGGLRTPSGQYYGKEVLPRWGTRPSSSADHTKYATEEHPPTKGWYRIKDGFSGWVKGDLPAEEVPDRYGDIDPDPAFLAGFDGRGMVYDPVGAGDVSAFPMQAEGYATVRTHEHLVAYLAAGLASDRQSLDAVRDAEAPPEHPAIVDYLALRELYVMIDRLPSRTYVRAGRISPIYGWRIADHTAYIRRDLGFDVNRQVFGVEAGWNPSYPYASVSTFVEGLQGWPGDEGNPGHGISLNAGYRDLGWQAGISHHQVWRPDRRDLITGVQWGLNLYPFVLMGEYDLRDRLATGAAHSTSLFAYNELNWLLQWGITAKVRHEWIDGDVKLNGDHRNRFVLGGEFHPYTFTQIEPLYRMTLIDGGAGLAGDRYPGVVVYDARQQVLHELMLQVHVWL